MYKKSGEYERGAGIHLETKDSILNIGGDATISGNRVYIVDSAGNVTSDTDFADVDIDLFDGRILNVVSPLTTGGYIGIFLVRKLMKDQLLSKETNHIL